MGIVTIDKPGKESFSDNQTPDDMSFTSGSREFKPPYQARIDYRAILAYTIAGCVSFLVFWLIYGFWKLSFCWNRNYATCAIITNIEPLVFGVVFLGVWLLAVAAVATRIISNWRQAKAVASRTNLVLDRFGDQIPTNLFERITNTQEFLKYIGDRYNTANELQKIIAPYQQYKSVNSLSLNSTNTTNTPMLDVGEIDETIKPIMPEDWLEWVNQRPHIILAGATGKGKTVTAKPIIAARIAANEQCMVIDPHADHWFGLDVIGGGENWFEIQAAIEQVTLEYNSRQMARETYRRMHGRSMPVELFPRLNVLMDEGYLISLHTNTAKRGETSTWEKFSEIFSSGARKINISLILLTQTANCDDLGISGPLRENFTRIAVDNRAIKLMIKNEEADASRRQQLYDALIGMAYPAVTVVDTNVVLLDRTGLDQVPDPSITPANHYPFVRPSGNGSNSLNGNHRTDGRNTADQLSALKASNVTREDARLVYGLVFSNEDWTDA